MEFGVLSTAGIGTKSVIPGIRKSDHEVGAISSRTEDRAAAVADEFDVPRAHDSYEALLADDDVDAVYVPLPNSLHAEWTKRAADAGKHVLCEKPLASDAAEAREVIRHCREQEVTLMEAFMYRFHPRTRRAAEIVADELRDVQSVTASFKFALRDRPDDIRLRPDLAGGSIMDVGCYAISAARLLLGHPDRAYARTVDTRDCGTDTQMTGVLEYDSGATAQVSSGFDTVATERYRVEGTNGWLAAENAFGPDPDESVSLTYEVDGERTTETFDPVDHYRLEVEAFADCVEAGRTPLVDAEETLGNMAVVDALRESGETGEPVAVEPVDIETF